MIGALVRKFQTEPDALSALVPKLALGVTVLLVVLLADRLAVLAWWLVPVPQPEQSDQPLRGVIPGGAQSGDQEGYEQVAAWSLFGKVGVREAPQKKVEETPSKAPETKLNLVLRGVYHTEDQDRAMAIIASQGGREEVFSVGQRLPGDAELREVRPERVVLFRQGSFESLSFPESKTAGAITAVRAAAPASQVTATANRINVTSLADRYRENISSDPTSLNDIAQVQPNIESGVLRGFRLRPGRKRELLRQLGLRPGDIVTNINGVPLDSMAQAMDSLQSFLSANEVQVTVLRNGQEIPFTYRLN
jgi:general secretion pathway protein C